jgi:hypothetical protein
MRFGINKDSRYCEFRGELISQNGTVLWHTPYKQRRAAVFKAIQKERDNQIKQYDVVDDTGKNKHVVKDED